MNEKCIVIITAALKPNAAEMDEFKEYSKRSNANGEAHGAVVLSRYNVTENVGQGIKPNMVLTVEYPSKEKALQSFSNEEYQSIIPLRDQAFEEVKILFTS